ncbi:hypothetical protein D3C84_1123700 [compost metagenome]
MPTLAPSSEQIMALTMAPIIRFISEISFDSSSRGTSRLKAISPITSPSPPPTFSVRDLALIAIRLLLRGKICRGIFPLAYISGKITKPPLFGTAIF